MNNHHLVCVCGFIGNTGHVKKCLAWKNEISRITKNIDEYLPKYYLKTYSVSDCITYVRDKEVTTVGSNKLREIITTKLQTLNLFEGVAGKNMQRMKQKKVQATTMARHGVINIGQLRNSGRTILNKIPYDKLPMMTDLAIYRKEVENLTFKYTCKLKKDGNLPIKCYYTNYLFNDVVLDKVNPNDPLKRTIDHIVPVTEAYLLGWTPVECADPTNLVFCLRVVNSLKHNTDIDKFKTMLLPHIMRKLNEN